MKFNTQILTALIIVLTSFALFSFNGRSRISEDHFRNLTFNGYSTVDLSFPQFDPRRGSLIGVQFGIELDGQWEETVVNTGPNPDSIAFSWNSNLAGYYPPTVDDLGTDGYAAFAMELNIPSQGILLQRRTVYRDVEFAIIQPDQPTVFFQEEDNTMTLGPIISSPDVLSAVTGNGDFTLPVDTEGYLATAGNPQGTIQTNCFATAVTQVRYIYKEN